MVTGQRAIICLSIADAAVKAYLLDVPVADADALRALMPRVEECTLIYPMPNMLARTIQPGFSDTDFSKVLTNTIPIIKPKA